MSALNPCISLYGCYIGCDSSRIVMQLGKCSHCMHVVCSLFSALLSIVIKFAHVELYTRRYLFSVRDVISARKLSTKVSVGL